MKPHWISRTFVKNNAKLWTNGVYGVATWIVIHQELKSTLNENIFFIWMAVVGGSELVKRLISAKFGVTSEEPPTKEAPSASLAHTVGN